MGGGAQVYRYSLALPRLPLPQAGTAALPTKARVLLEREGNIREGRTLLEREGNYVREKGTIRKGRELLEREGHY